MDEIQNPSPPSSSAGFSPPARSDWRLKLRVIFFGPDGLRAGWRALIFLTICYIMLLLVSIAYRVILASRVTATPGVLSPNLVLTIEVLSVIALFLTMLVISSREKRAIDSYGLPLRRAFRSTFWNGTVFGFVFLTLLLLVLRALHGFHFGTLSLRGGVLLRYAFLWAIAFFLVGIFEEYSCRGYLQFVLSRGTGFWLAAVLTSLLFAALHRSNNGESWIGLVGVFAVGLFFCLTLRRTGDLWFAVGFHASWDYAQSFVYGVPDSGQLAVGHLFNPQLQQSPAWLTGGSAGPEGSVLVFADLAVAALVVARCYPKVRYPELAPAVPNPVPAESPF